MAKTKAKKTKALKPVAPATVKLQVAKPGTLAPLDNGEKPLVLGHVERQEDPETAKARKLAELRQTEAEEAEQERIAARVDVDTLSKAQLIVHAKRSFGVDLPEKSDVAELRTTVKRLVGRDIAASRNVRSAGR